MKIAVFWFRRDLRLADNTGLNAALSSGLPVLPLFIFDKNILDNLPKDDARLTFIHESLADIDKKLRKENTGILTKYGKPAEVWKELLGSYDIQEVYTNKDYEPYARRRDGEIAKMVEKAGGSFKRYKDQVIHEERDVLKDDGDPYTVYTPYKNKWLSIFDPEKYKPQPLVKDGEWFEHNEPFMSLEDIDFEKSSIEVPPIHLEDLESYGETRNFPIKDSTSHLGPHLRFGTVSVRKIIDDLSDKADVFLSELIWREFFMTILYHFPKVVDHNFKAKYDQIKWRNNEDEFKRWCEGNTGYPIVDAGMRELNTTGYMHNRVRMITASFLCKHLLIDWKWGEAYFAEKLLDYDLSANNGNWQWAAGTGCDAAPYFRIFNPAEQVKKFDKDYAYIKKWVPEYKDKKYPEPMVDHKMARERALETYKSGLDS